ncbi:hypothetical protein LCGC14_0406720 [marine sediment metagenome]|uniref:Uncharacterized protein n=1 Tax=marine sediment metagenome TaxID=412755 RepID=A0A0F9TD80_9ZZZZ
MTNGARAQIQIDEINKDIRKICKWIKGIENDYRKQRKANKLSLSYRLYDIAIGLLAGLIYLSAVYYLSIWRW